MNTKIVATIGPTSESPEMLSKMILAGMNVARFNFSHCSYEQYHRCRLEILRLAKKHKRHVDILQDLQGPRIRVGTEIPKEGRVLRDKELVVFSTKKESDPSIIFIDYANLHQEIKVGEKLYLMNGQLELVVRSIRGTRIAAEVIRGGTLYPRKGINVPDTKISISGLTKQDKKDLAFGLAEGADYVAISFVQSGDDLRAARKLIGDKAKIITKVETPFAVRDIDDVIRESDVIMVARGDLGIEIPEEKIPFIQKHLVRQAAWHGKGSIVATQVLLSMTQNAFPTRAEVSDIANAVMEGADAIMLSEETANGKYPIESIETLARVIRETERLIYKENYFDNAAKGRPQATWE